MRKHRRWFFQSLALLTFLDKRQDEENQPEESVKKIQKRGGSAKEMRKASATLFRDSDMKLTQAKATMAAKKAQYGMV